MKISNIIKESIITHLVYCTTEQMVKIISDFNSEIKLSSSDSFMLGIHIGKVIEFENECKGKDNNLHELDSLVKHIFTNKVDDTDKFLKMGLTKRTINILNENNIFSLNDLKNKRWREISQMYKIGEKVTMEIQKVLLSHGIKLKK